jgi:hypothetical protein
MKVKNHTNRESFPKNYKLFTMPSETIPDQTLTMRELLDRHSRGLPINVKTPIWDEESDIDDIMPDPRTLDISERQEFANSAKAELEGIKEKLNTIAKNKKKPADEPPADAGGEPA